MKFGIDTILDSFEVSFDLKKISFLLIGLVIAAIGGGLLLYLANLAMGSIILSLIFGILAAIWLYVVIVITKGGLCRMISSEMTGKGSIGMKEALAFTKAKAVSLIFTPIMLILSIAALVVVQLIAMWILSKIPYLGPIIASLATIPLLVVNTIAGLALIFGGSLVAPIIAIDELSIKETILRIIQVVKKDPIHLITYIMLAILLLYIVILGVATILMLGGVITLGGSFPMMQAVSDGIGGGNIAAVIALLSVVIVALLAYSYLVVIVSGIYTSMYLAIKERLVK